jgi:hypothetical protein
MPRHPKGTDHSTARSPARRTHSQTASYGGAIVLSLLVAWSHQLEPAQASDPNTLWEITHHGGVLVGLPVIASQQEVWLMDSTGRVHGLGRAAITAHRRLDERFEPLTPEEQANRLSSAFGSHYETLAAAPYAVVAPVGHAQAWAKQLNQFYREFQRHFSSRGLSLDDPQGGLVVVCYASRAQFRAAASHQRIQINDEVLGFYCEQSNWIHLYEHPEEGAGEQLTAAVVRHEAAHQLGFNTGLHTRLGATPHWLLEGLACILEVSESSQPAGNGTRPTVHNRLRLDDWRRLAEDPARARQRIAQLIVSDQPLRDAPLESYAAAWALTHYLAEREPQRLRAYLETIRQHRYGQGTRTDERQRDFELNISPNLPQLTRRLISYYDTER